MAIRCVSIPVPAFSPEQDKPPLYTPAVSIHDSIPKTPRQQKISENDFVNKPCQILVNLLVLAVICLRNAYPRMLNKYISA
ncbi:hypothetical protein DCM91_06675 [Chitinophaga costaii]|nr:hypothetical protein DCM91_06675 [Chitinophaga costaii]